MKKLKQNQKGFTLIELLVVIAIIGLLASVVLLALNSARGKGRDARRLSELRQITAAAQLQYDNTGSYAAVAGELGGEAIPDQAAGGDCAAAADYSYTGDATGFSASACLEQGTADFPVTAPATTVTVYASPSGLSLTAP